MASYHLSAKIGMKGKAQAHAAYIAREGKYSEGKRYEDLEATGSGNMPKWAEHSPSEFWKAADDYERANGSAYREIEVALPRELTPEKRLELVQDFIAQELGKKHAYQFAIHTPKAALEKGEQPHAHIMYSERIIDGIERDPEQYFKRYNAKFPEKGGAKKFSGGKQANELKTELLATRERWAIIQNKHLEKYGHTERVTHLSLEEQGITDRQPEKHLGGTGVRNKEAKNKLLELRAAIAESVQINSEAQEVVMAVKANSAWNKYNERKTQAEAEKLAAEEAKKAKIEQEERDRKERISREVSENIERIKKELEEKKAQEEALKLARLEKEQREKIEREKADFDALPPEQRAQKIINDFYNQERANWRSAETNKIQTEAKKLRDDAKKLQDEETEKPLLFGRKEWEERHHEIDSQVSWANRKARDMVEGLEWTLQTHEPPNLRWNAMQRLQCEQPELYQALKDAEKKQREEENAKREKARIERLVRKSQYKKDDFER